jgi:hypothetical protein
MNNTALNPNIVYAAGVGSSLSIHLTTIMATPPSSPSGWLQFIALGILTGILGAFGAKAFNVVALKIKQFIKQKPENNGN